MNRENMLRWLPGRIDGWINAVRHQEAMRKLSNECRRVLPQVRRGTSLRKFAKRMGVSPTFLSLVERGKTPMTLKLAKKVLEYMKANAPAGEPAKEKHG